MVIGLTEIDKMESIVKSEHLVELMKDNEIAILEMLIIYGFAFCKNMCSSSWNKIIDFWFLFWQTDALTIL